MSVHNSIFNCLCLLLSTALCAKEIVADNQWERSQGTGIYLTGEFLWWRAVEGGTEYALDRELPDFPSSAATIQGSLKKVAFHFDPGFRLAIGGILNERFWDFSVQWTHFDTDRFRKTIPVFGGSELSTRINSGFLQGAATSASAHWDIHYDFASFDLGRLFSVHKHFGLRPFGGIVGAQITQKMHFSYPDVQLTTGSALVQARQKNRFTGIGMHVGVDSRWPIRHGFSFYGTGAAALLWGEYNVHQHESAIDKANFSDHFRDIAPELQLALGLRWDRDFSAFRLGFHAGYEMALWFDQNQIRSFASTSATNPVGVGQPELNRGDLGFEGLTLGTRVDF